MSQKGFFVLLSMVLFIFLALNSPSPALATKGDMADKVSKINAAFDVNKMGDMSDFDPPTR